MKNKVGIIGWVNLGETLGRLLIKAGYQLAISNSTWQETLEFVESIEGSNSSIVTSEDALRFGEVCCNTMEKETWNTSI